jgi:DNA repair protein RadC
MVLSPRVIAQPPVGRSNTFGRHRAVTRQLVDAGRMLDIPGLDHLIIAGDRDMWFAQAGLL